MTRAVQGPVQGAFTVVGVRGRTDARPMNIRAPKASFAAAVAVGAAIVVPALAAQSLPGTRIESHAVATPSRAGTPQHPVGLSVTASARLITAPDVEAPVVTGIDILIGKGLSWNNGGFVTCAKARLDRSGPKGCPPRSLMGSAYATGRADTVPARLDLTFFNGGPDLVYVYAVLSNPARVRETLTLHTRRLTAPGPWGESETIDVPRSLQVVAGVPLTMDQLKLTVGGKSYAKKFIYSTSCPQGGWRYRVDLHYAYESTGRTSGDATSGAIACS
jgi:hypothetical protein